MPRDDFDDWRMLSGDMDEYVAKVQKARRDHPGLAIKLSLEVDYLPGYEAWIRELAARHSWDYLIGAVHYVSDSWDLDNPKKISEWKERDPFEVWSAYFERLTLATESGLFETIAHADLCKKFCFYPKQDCTQTKRCGHGTQHVRLAQRLQRNLSESSNRDSGGANGRADHLCFGCALARRSGDELRRSCRTGTPRGLYSPLPVHTTTTRRGEVLRAGVYDVCYVFISDNCLVRRRRPE